MLVFFGLYIDQVDQSQKTVNWLGGELGSVGKNKVVLEYRPPRPRASHDLREAPVRFHLLVSIGGI